MPVDPILSELQKLPVVLNCYCSVFEYTTEHRQEVLSSIVTTYRYELVETLYARY